MYVFEKTVATFGTFALLYTMTENFILPLVPTSKEQPFIRSLLDLALPFMLAYLLLFYIIFGAQFPSCTVAAHTNVLVQNAYATDSLNCRCSRIDSSTKTGYVSSVFSLSFPC